MNLASQLIFIKFHNMQIDLNYCKRPQAQGSVGQLFHVLLTLIKQIKEFQLHQMSVKYGVEELSKRITVGLDQTYF